MAQKPSLPIPVEHKLLAIRSMLRRYVAAQTLLLIVGWLLVIFWGGGLLDYLPVRAGSNETPRWLRAGLLAAMVIGSIWILSRWTIPRILTPLHDRSLALLIERQHPSLNNALVTAVELSAGDEVDVSNPVIHEAMMERVRKSVSEYMQQVSPVELFNWQPLWGTGTAVVFGLLITMITAIGMPNWLGLWTQRLFILSDVPWPRAAELRADGIQLQFPLFTGQLTADRVMISFDSGVAHIPAGATGLLQISANADAKVVPEVCTLFYRSNDGMRGRANLRRVGSPRDGWQQFTLDGSPLDGLSEDMEFDVVGLDARLRDLRLQVEEPAVVSDLKLACRYPGYLRDSLSSRPSEEVIAYRAGMRIPEGTEITLLGQSNSQLKRVEYVLRQTASASSDASEVEQFKIASVVPEGNLFRIELGTIRESQVVEIRLIDEFGLSSDQILRYIITVLEDLAPEVDSTLAGIGSAVTPNAVLPVRGTVVDDNGIAQVFIEVAVNESEPLKLPLQVPGDGELQAEVDLEKIAADGQMQLVPDGTLGLVVSAIDFFNLDDQQHIGRGQPQQLAIVTPDQLLVLLDRQELELRQRLELIIIELQQVKEVLELLGSSFERGDESVQLLSTPADRIVRVPTQRVDKSVRSSIASVSAFQESTIPNDQDDSEATERKLADSQAQRRRMAVLRAQQSQLQCDKSEQELNGVAKRVDNLRLQLLNNRIDSYDRQNRLQSKVHEPLVALLDGQYRSLNRSLSELQTATLSDQGFEQAQSSLTALSEVLDALELIKSNMLDIESFNEIVDLVRSLLEDQENLLNETEKQQKARILDLLR